MSKSVIAKTARVTITVMTIVIVAAPANIVFAGAPYQPELVSPANGSTADSNPPTLCARNNGDPDGDQVSIRFEVHGGGEGDHISPWINAGNPGNVVCWTDTGTWTAQSHRWQVRAIDSRGDQAGATPEWGVNIPAPPAAAPACTINSLSVNPVAPQNVGTTVSISVSASCTNGVSALRFKINGGELRTVSSSSATVSWSTSGYAPTDHVITVESADNVGGYIQTRSHTYTLTQPGSSGSSGGSSGGSQGSGSTGSSSQPATSANPPISSSPAPAGAGGMNLDAYCASRGLGRAINNAHNVTSWACQDNAGRTYGIDMTDVCRWQYGGGTPGFGNSSDPYSWYCSNTASLPTSGSTSNNSSTRPQAEVNTSITASSPGNNQSGEGEYTVASGDSLYRIARRTGTTVDTLIQLNRDKYPSLTTNPGYLLPGWTLVASSPPRTPATQNERTVVATCNANPFVYEFYRDPSNMLNLLVPLAGRGFVYALYDALQAIGVLTDVANRLTVDPFADEVTLVLWRSGGTGNYYLDAIRRLNGRVLSTDTRPIAYGDLGKLCRAIAA